MNNEFNNMNYYYDYYSNNEYIVILSQLFQVDKS